jgi:exoribonuclease-2
MEYFWCLRWLKQEGKKHVAASVVKDDLVRLDEIPLMLHVPGLGVHARGTKVMLDVMSLDELTVEASCRLLHVIDAPVSGSAQDAEAQQDETEEELIEAEDLSAESEAEAQAEAVPEGDATTDESAATDEPAGESAPDTTEPTR